MEFWWMILLLLAGLVFVLFELLTPSFGILTAAAVASFIGSIWMGFQVNSGLGFASLIVEPIVALAFFMVMLRVLPKLSLTRGLYLGKQAKAQASGTPDSAGHGQLIGQVGVTETMLRPSGAVRVAGRRMIALAESGVIDKDQKVKVISSDGMNVVVRKID